MIEIIIPREVPSGNAFAYSHWSVRTKDRNAWSKWLIRAKSNMHSEDCQPATGHRFARIIAYRPRILDDDNLSAGAKHLRDAIVRAGFLKDDNKKWSTWQYVQRLRSHPENPTPKQSCTVVEIDTEPPMPITGKENA